MLIAPHPEDEAGRLHALRLYQAFQTGPEPGFDRITALAARTLGAPLAFVTLVGEDTQWLKSCFGPLDTRETSREIAFCAHTILSDGILIVPDATLDPRFWDNPLVVGPPYIRFYAGCPLRSPSGHNVGALCVIDTEPRDITVEMRTALRDFATFAVDQLELRRWRMDEDARFNQDAETNYHRLADAIRGLVFRVRQTSDTEMQYLYASPGSNQLLGLSPEAIYAEGQPLTSRVHRDDLQEMKDSIQRTWIDGSPWSWTGRLVLDGGRTKWVRGEGRCERREDGSLIIEGLIVDVSKSKEREAALIVAKEEAERANRAKGDFLSRTSHELRTPMNAILGFGQMLEMEPLSEEAMEDIAQIQKAGEHLLSLIDAMLDLSSVDSGSVPLVIEPLRLDDILSETIDLLRPLFQAEGIRIKALPVGDKAIVLADRHRLRQVVINLMTNAVKYNRQGGSVVVKVTEEDGAAALHVVDEGPGIPADKIDRLFTPFDRLGAEGTGIEGSGLGLAISRGLTELMGGSLDVSSVLGEGSTFSVRLPVVVDTVDAPPPLVEEAAPSALSKPEVLYVEDSESNILLVKRILGKRPEVHLTTAHSLASGLERLANQPPNVLLLDLNLPDGSGETIIHWVRTSSEYRALPIIVLTADATPDLAARVVASGADRLLTKPLKVSTFLEALDDAIKEPR